MATGQIGEAHVTLRATLDRYERDLNMARAATARAARQMAGDLGRVEHNTRRIEQSSHRAALGIQRLSRQFLVLRAAASAAVSVVGVRAVAQAADSWVLLGARLRLVSGSAEEAAAAQEELFQVAQRSRTPLADVATTFVRLRLATDELGLSEEAALRVTESFTKALIIGGATTAEASSALLQFSQALGRGVAKGDELRALYENFPGLFRLIGEESGKTGREVVQAALEEGLAVDKMINALISGREKIDADFVGVPITIGQSITIIRNSLEKAIGVTSTADSSYDSLVQTLIRLNDVVSSPEFATGLSTIFQGIALVIKDLANGIERIGHAVNILKLIADQDFGKLWEQYLSKGTAAEEKTKAVGKALEGIAESGDDEAMTEIMESLAKASQAAKNELALAELQLNNFFGAMSLLKGTPLEKETIAPEAVIDALKALAAAGYDVAGALGSMPPAIRATFLDLVTLGDRTAEVTVQIEDQADALKQLKDAHIEYQKSRVQGEGVDAAIERDKEAFEEWKRLQEEKTQKQKEFDERIAAGGRLPDEIDAANIAAQGLADTLTDFEDLSFQSLLDGIAGIAQQIAEAMIQALIFRAIMATVGGGGGGAASGLIVDPFIPSRYGNVFAGGKLKRMAQGGFITNRPMIVPMQSGGALIGEAGPEAVLPLKRMASGNLGVASEGGGGGSSSIINIDARQSTPGTTAAAVAAAVRLAPGAVVNANARGLVGRGKHPF
jgi:tape measure domain-containing protein